MGRETPAAGRPLIEIAELGVEYRRGGIVALEAVNLAIQPGEFIVILGPSGCGKSTLLEVLAGLMKPTNGEVRIDGRVNPAPGRDRGVVFQHAALLPWFNVLKNIEIGLRSNGLTAEAARKVALQYVEKVGLRGFERMHPNQLSGGMQQRVGVARAFAIDPPILLMDEPFGALDAQTRMVLQEELISLWEGTGKTVVFVTHSIDEAIFLADRIVVLTIRPGRVRDTVDVSLDRPRTDETRLHPDYLKLQATLWSLMRDDAQRAIVSAPVV